MQNLSSFITRALIEAVRSSETSVDFCKTTCHNVAQDSHVHASKSFEFHKMKGIFLDN